MRISDLFDRGVRLNPHGLALTGDGGDYSFIETQSLARRMANALVRDGFGPGTRFAVYGPNSGLAMIAVLGGLQAGGVWCAVNLRNAVDANAQILAAGGCEVILFAAETGADLTRIRATAPTIRLSVCLDGVADGAVDLTTWIDGVSDGKPEVTVSRDDIAFQGSTGGTTGAPKITLCTNDWLTMCALAWASCLHYDAPPVNLAATPITHAAGMMALAHLVQGGTVVMMARLDVGEMLRAIESSQITTIFLPPTIIYMLLAHPEIDAHDTSSLKYLLSSAAPIAPSRIREVVRRFGPVLAQAWGQTEVGFPITYMSPAETARAVQDPALAGRLLSCGRPTLIAEALEVVDDNGKILGAGELGELVLKGPTVMVGYRGDPAATAEVQRGGWHHTGDLGVRDADGYVYVTDRLRDMVISGGFNIYPFEIEQVVLRHPGVQDCAVIGVPDEKWGEALKLVVEPVVGVPLEAADLIGFCRERLGAMKTPKTVDLVEALPRTAVGKVLKRELRARYWADQNRNIS